MAEQTSNQAPRKVEVGSVFDLLGKSYNIVKNNWQMFAVVNIFGILTAILNALNQGDLDTNQQTSAALNGSPEFSGLQVSAIVGGGLLILLVFLIINLFLYTMAISLEVKSSGGQKPDFKQLFSDGKKYFFPLIGMVIVIGIIVLVGLMLLIVPGIIAIGRLIMAPYIMIDKKVGIDEALKQSNELGKKYFGKIWAAILVMILVSIFASILDAIPLLGPIAGIIVTIAFSLVIALRYQELQGRKV